MEEQTDSTLLRIVRGGGDDAAIAYETLVRRYQANLLRLALYLLGGDAEAEDVVQEAFVRTFTSLRRARPDTDFGPWIRTIVTRICFNRRRKWRAASKATDSSEEPTTKQPASARSALEWALERLPYPYREILILRFVEEMSMEEIAETLEVGISAAKMRLRRARERFVEVYKGEVESQPG